MARVLNRDEDKCPLPQDSGSEPYLPPATFAQPGHYWMESPIAGDRWKSVLEGLSIGSSSSTAKGSNVFPGSRKGSKVTGNRPGRTLPEITSGRKIQGLMAASSNLARCHSEEMKAPTGSLLEVTPKPEGLEIYQQTYTFAVIHRSSVSEWTILWLFELNVLVSSFGGELELENLGQLGKKPVTWHTAKIRVRNGGAAIKARKMLLSMSFVEQSESVTCLDGWIDTLSVWRLKEDLNLLLPARYGLLQTWIHDNGIPTWMKLPKKHFSEGWW